MCNHMDVEPKIGGENPPKMDGENNGKPYEQMDDLGVPLFLETPIYIYIDEPNDKSNFVSYSI